MANRHSEWNLAEQDDDRNTGIGSEDQVRGGGAEDIRGVGDDLDDFDEDDEDLEDEEEGEDEGTF